MAMGEGQPSLPRQQPIRLSPDNNGSDSDHSLHKSDEEAKGSFDSSPLGLTSTLLQQSPELEAQVSSRVQDAPENQVPRGTKITFIALYLFLNLSLTLSNKSVLSQVGSFFETHQNLFADIQSAQPTMAFDRIAYYCNIDRHICFDGDWPSTSHTSQSPLAPQPPRIFHPLYAQHRNLQRFACDGISTLSSDHAIHVSCCHHTSLPHHLFSLL